MITLNHLFFYLLCIYALTSLLVIVHPEYKNWIRYAKFEETNGYIAKARSVYERAVEFFGEEYMDEKLFVAFAKFEENQKEVSFYFTYIFLHKY